MIECFRLHKHGKRPLAVGRLERPCPVGAGLAFHWFCKRDYRHIPRILLIKIEQQVFSDSLFADRQSGCFRRTPSSPDSPCQIEKTKLCFVQGIMQR